MTPPQLSTFRSQRLTLSLARWGDPSAPPLVLVHGGRDQKRSWDWMATALADCFHVHAHDLRGHGQSDQVTDGDYGVMDHVFDLASLVDQIGAETITLIGHSLGGNIAVRYAGLFPERVNRLVAIEGLGPSPKMVAERAETPIEDRLREWVDQRRSLSERVPRRIASLDEAISRMAAAHPHLRDDQIRHLTETGIAENPDGSVRWAYDPAGLGRSPADIRQEDFQRLWGRITCPTLLLYGANSWASNPETDGRIAHFNNDPEVIEIENAGHWLHHDQLDEVLVHVRQFLTAPPS